MIYYLTNHLDKTKIIYENKEEVIDKSLKQVINDLCKKHLVDIKGYLKISRNIFNFKYNMPLFLSNNILLFNIFNIKNYDNIWINYHSLNGYYYEYNKIVFIFKNMSKLEVDTSLNKIDRISKLCEEIVNYKKNN